MVCPGLGSNSWRVAILGRLGMHQASTSMPYNRLKIHRDCQLLVSSVLDFFSTSESALAKRVIALSTLAILSFLSLSGLEASR